MRVRPLLPSSTLVVALVLSAFLGAGPARAGSPRPQSVRAGGRFTLNPNVRPADCPSTFSDCHPFTVSACPGVSASAKGEIAWQAPPTGTDPVGVVVFFTGSGGTEWWTERTNAPEFQTRLQGDGFLTVLVRWVTPWGNAPSGEQLGLVVLACRPATAIRWAYKQLYLPLGLSHAAGECGFCTSGQSGGGGQTGYPLEFYGQDAFTDGVVETSGPSQSDQVKGCTDPAANAYTKAERLRADDAYGFLSGNTNPGPCMQADASFDPTWTRDSLATGAGDFVHPATPVSFVIGSMDDKTTKVQAPIYCHTLQGNAGNHITWNIVQGMGHDVRASPEGLDDLELALQGSPVSTGPC